MSPDSELAQLVSTALREKCNLPESLLHEVLEGLANGTATESSWAFWSSIGEDDELRMRQSRSSGRKESDAPSTDDLSGSSSDARLKAPRISKLALRKFRGATDRTEIEFSKDKPVCMIFGENGTGKSTIADGIDIVCNGVTSDVKSRSGFEQRHLSAIGSALRDIEIELASEYHTWTARCAATKVFVSPESPRPPQSVILRRSKLSNLVEARPGERYEELRTFIDVSKVESAEKQLDDAIRTAERAFERASIETSSASAGLDDLWKSIGQGSGVSAITWAEQSIGMDLTKLAAENDLLRQISDSCSKLLDASDEIARSQERYHGELAELKRSEKLLAEDGPFFQTAEDEPPKLLRVLTGVHDYVVEHPSSSCIVCRSPVDHNSLLSQLAERTSRKDINVQARSPEPVDYTPAAISRASGYAAKLIHLIDSRPESSPLGAEDLPKVLETLTGPSDPEKRSQAISKVQKMSELAETSRESNRRKQDSQASAKRFRQTLFENGQRAKELEHTIRRLKSWLGVARETRIKYTQDILDSIADECKRLYDLIHPDEPISIKDIRMDPSKRASIIQRATFGHYDDVSPQAYFSDAHLDTLGFCFWLAIVSRGIAKNKVIVLDDVFTSVDSAHMRRIALLLEGEKDKYAQIIILTHYRQWQTYYRMESPNVQLIELHSWTIERGVAASGIAPDLAELKGIMEQQPVNRQALASKVGILLEYYLDKISLEYGCSLPRKADYRYTLGEYLDGTSKIVKILKVKRLGSGDGAVPDAEEVLAESFGKLAKLSFIRNEVGCHFNRLGDDISNSDVLEFAKASIDFIDRLVCAKCASISLKLAKGGANRICACGQTQITPPSKP